jgi:hypothetical protein
MNDYMMEHKLEVVPSQLTPSTPPTAAPRGAPASASAPAAAH